MRRLLGPAVLIVALAGASQAATAAVPTPKQVARVVLTPAQVGKGYLLLIRKDSTGTTTPTLNLCGTKGYPSEKLRVTRIQVDYGKQRSTFALSNEVVSYTAGGTAQAMREVKQHALHCPKGLVDSGQVGTPKLHFRFTVLHDAKLLKGALVLRIRSTGIYKGKHVDQTSYAVYQTYRGILSGVYSSGPNTKAQPAFVLHAAEQSARNLKRGAPAAPKGPTA